MLYDKEPRRSNLVSSMMSPPTVASIFVLLISSAAATASELNDVLFSGNYEFIDLTHPFDNQTLYWPGAKNFEFTKVTEKLEADGSWYAMKEFAASEHGGTHIDAPYHFLMKGQYVGEIPLEKLILPLIIADVSSQTNDNPNFVLYKSHLDYILNDNVGKPCVIIFKFGWSKYFGDKEKYYGLNQNGSTTKLNFPGLSAEVAEWITTNYKNVQGVGVDVGSVDPGSTTDFPVHKIFAKAGLYNIENTNLSRPVPEYGCTALVLPMKIAQGSGAPLRLVAICPKKIPTSF